MRLSTFARRLLSLSAASSGHRNFLPSYSKAASTPLVTSFYLSLRAPMICATASCRVLVFRREILLTQQSTHGFEAGEISFPASTRLGLGVTIKRWLTSLPGSNSEIWRWRRDNAHSLLVIHFVVWWSIHAPRCGVGLMQLRTSSRNDGTLLVSM
ncbi:hypothetical protein B0I35DRAFT_447376 [Stachybotrys elegans]|uniref:Uncharacterized protein n=1 Tax=Stachybotrys elegans TaxID=80388 RepID=A0A8K0WK64_9HYPO|nr:hypothetical protein B0I35DRAFT_447376 [Stachybotrys elegans]